MTNIKLAITDFVGFLCRQGHISSEFSSSVSALEGSQLHRFLQKSRPSHYQSEVYLTHTHNFEDHLSLTLSGRADGIFESEEGIVIEEIKSTNQSLDDIEMNTVHLAQAKLYAFIYAKEHHLEEIHIHLTYIHQKTKETHTFCELETYANLELYLDNLFIQFKHFYDLVHTHQDLRNISIQKMHFPYDTFRQGQKEMAMSCFKAIKQKEVLFIQAPTGIGKTLSTLYPAIQALGKHTSKIMYLTAKTVTRQVAIDSVELLKRQGLYLNYVVITAKDKICFFEKSQCHPDSCPYAHQHYNRINATLLDVLQHETTFTKDIITKYATKHQVCPFELSLDLYSFSDVSISDYNYAFDPKVNLKRAFEENNHYTLLVDEAHNLVDRARQMYSATIDLETLKYTKRLFKPKKGRLYRSFKKIVDFVDNIDHEENYIKKEMPQTLINEIQNFVMICKEELPSMFHSEMKEALVDSFFMLNDTLRISEYYNENYITYYENHQLKLFCLDASEFLRNIYNKCQAVILFSATLLPISYFFQLNGGKEGDKKLYFDSPFPQENQLLLVARDVNATYRYRHTSYDTIVHYLKQLTKTNPGHYLVFFPSYAYLNEVSKRIVDIDITLQTTQMSEENRDAFLLEFQKEPEKSKLFFCVLGGVFSEGIDLKGNQVIGVVIVSVGLPQLCLERELIKVHFDKQSLGYHYAYVYPGFNKVLQAAGRLIRTMDDRGVVLLLDERYLSDTYLSLFPRQWHHAKTTSINEIQKQLSEFAKNDNEDTISVEKDIQFYYNNN